MQPPSQTIQEEHTGAVCLSLLERGCARMARAGGGALSQEQPQRQRHESPTLTADEKQIIARLLYRGTPQHEIVRALHRRFALVKAYMDKLGSQKYERGN